MQIVSSLLLEQYLSRRYSGLDVRSPNGLVLRHGQQASPGGFAVAFNTIASVYTRYCGVFCRRNLSGALASTRGAVDRALSLRRIRDAIRN